MVVRDPYGRLPPRRGPVAYREPIRRRQSYPQRPPRLPKDKPPRNWKRFARRFMLAASILLTLLILGGGLAFWVIWSSLTLPPDRVLSQTSYITDSSGKYQLASFNAGENRIPVALRDVPKVVRDAVISTEDRKFYTHHGVDPIGVTRALYVDLRGRSRQGGSTITQQYVKQAYEKGKDRTPGRKVKEAVLAVKLEQRYSKDQILERYLNIIYLGRSSYGIQTASNAYFGKDIQKANLEEAAYLAGLIRGPELADAYKSPDEAELRRMTTLRSMVRDGIITEADMNRVMAKPLKSYVLRRAPASKQTRSDVPGAEYFRDWVQRVLKEKYGEEVVEAGGLQVKTSLDLNEQRVAYETVYGFLNQSSDPAGALVSLDKDGYVRAMVGGRDYSVSQVNLAIGKDGGGAGRHAGSTFKPFELAANIEKGGCLKDTYSAPPSIELPGWDSDPTKPQIVNNYEGETFGKMNLLDATAHSVNTVYAQLIMKDRPANLIRVAKRAGITSPLPENNSIVLGAVDVSPLEMADAYLTFSQRGIRALPNPILEVKKADGQVERSTPKRSRQIDQSVADTVNFALQRVITDGTGKKAGLSVPVAGKSGTTEDFGDAWFVGYTTERATAIWLGYPEGSAHTMTDVRGIHVTGGTFPAQMFQSFMQQVISDESSSQFNRPRDCQGTDYSGIPDSEENYMDVFERNKDNGNANGRNPRNSWNQDNFDGGADE